ncbi:pseudouridine kinase [Alkalispirochaeta americana]|uniref:Pseudouridine kinase n=1 Tax=Alkalispirochaeta americana TaxID=159291 RepID=A0A1N6RAA7_9SPIO|nr:PfkB family carbohydrate kinase [Alkalispirochaeta americana]SIQ25789.1 pseudouridine kinase [Alkalispirochaeta americana]
MTNREGEILRIIAENPMISQQALAERLGIQRSSVAVHISRLISKGLIAGRGYILGGTPPVVVVGGSNMDIQGYPDQPLRRRDSNPGRVLLSPGGVGRNIAESLARLEVPVKLLSVVGDDDHGRQILESSRTAGVDVSHLLVTQQHSTAVYLSILDETGDMDLALVQGTINSVLDREYLKQKRSIIENAAALVVEANLDQEVIEVLCRSVQDVPVFVDPVSSVKARKLRPLLDAIHTLKPNALEAQELTGVEITSEADLERAADVLLQAGVQNVAVSWGSAGTYYLNSRESGWVRPEGVSRVVSATGAGDAFLAGLVQSFLRGEEFSRGVHHGSALARRILTGQGLSPPPGEALSSDVSK